MHKIMIIWFFSIFTLGELQSHIILNRKNTDSRISLMEEGELQRRELLRDAIERMEGMQEYQHNEERCIRKFFLYSIPIFFMMTSSIFIFRALL